MALWDIHGSSALATGRLVVASIGFSHFSTGRPQHSGLEYSHATFPSCLQPLSAVALLFSP